MKDYTVFLYKYEFENGGSVGLRGVVQLLEEVARCRKKPGLLKLGQSENF